MQIKKAPVKDLVSPDWNPRQITTEELEKLKTSLEEFGYIEPIIVNDVNNHVVGGNQRLKALIALGYDEVDCVYVHIEDIAKEKACNVALNKISGDWDEDKLRVVLEDIELSPIDIKLTGFDDIELTNMEITPNEPVEVVEDDYKEPDDLEVTVQQGDIYQLGEHRLMCGDSTKESDVNLLLNGNLAQLVFTDPPYNVDYSGRGEVNKLGHIENDNMSDEEFDQFCNDFFKIYHSSLEELGIIYVCHPDAKSAPKIAFETNFAKYFKKSSTIIWVKQSAGMGWQDYRSQHEPILYGWKKGNGKHNFFGDRTNTTIWQFNRDNVMEYNHPTQKPVGLPAKAIQNSSKEKGIVLDLFGGSGSTLIACEQLNRRCYIMELDPYYCQVIINRWEEYTGRKAEKLPL